MKIDFDTLKEKIHVKSNFQVYAVLPIYSNNYTKKSILIFLLIYPPNLC